MNIIKPVTNHIIRKSANIGYSKINNMENYIIDSAISYIKNKISYSITYSFYSNDICYILSYWLCKYHKDVYTKYAYDGGERFNKIAKNTKKSIFNLNYILDGTIKLIHNKTIVIITKNTKYSNDGEDSYASVTIRFVGVNAKKTYEQFKKFVSNCVHILNNKKQPTIMGYNEYNVEADIRNMRPIWHARDKGKSFNNIFITKEIYNEMITYLNNIDKLNKKMCDKDLFVNGGILLYGKPGTGKTSIYEALANYLCYDVYIVDMTDIKTSVSVIKDKLTNLRASYQYNNNNDNNESVILLFEDIDFIFGKRDNEMTEKEKENSRYLLQVLDGTESIPHSINIATTNQLDVLDDAIIREGRFDLKLHIDGMQEKEAKKMCDYFDVNYDILNGVKYPINPSYLRSKIIKSYSDKIEMNKVDTITGIREDE